MTLNYNKDIMTSHPWTFIKLLFNWRASIWKAVYVELICWFSLYVAVTIMYRFALSDSQMRSFENVVGHFEQHMKYIPLDLILGFFVSCNIDRWVWRYRRIGFIDNVGLMVAEYVRGHNETGRRLRRDILRYSQLGQILVFRDISLRCRNRFPTLSAIVEAGFMRPDEKFELENMRTHYAKHWVPFQWAMTRCYEARKLGHIESDYYQTAVVDEIRTFRFNMEENVSYDWTPLPLSYANVVCLAVHVYFLVAVLGRQFVVGEDSSGKAEVGIYFPFMPVVEFVFYMGWLKVAEVAVNPFGEDDDDWETNALTDRNIAMGLMIVDGGFDRTPELKKDVWWNEHEVRPIYDERLFARDNGDGDAGMHGSVSQVKFGSGAKRITMVRRSADALPSLSHSNGIKRGGLRRPHSDPHYLEQAAYCSTEKDQAPLRKNSWSHRISFHGGIRKMRSMAWMNGRDRESVLTFDHNHSPKDCHNRARRSARWKEHSIELTSLPSQPVEVAPPPNHSASPEEVKRISLALPPVESAIADEHLYCSDLDPRRVEKLHEQLLLRKKREKELSIGTDKPETPLPEGYALPSRPL